MFTKLLISTLTSLTTTWLSLPMEYEMISDEPRLILNMKNDYELPRNFRSTEPKYIKDLKGLSIVGLTNLRASASGQFSSLSLQKIIDILPQKNLYIVDLRQESHIFINDMAVSWYGPNNWTNKNKTLVQIQQDESKKIHNLKTTDTALFKSKSSNETLNPIAIENVYTEEELTKHFGVKYIRIPITDHIKPTDARVDQFISFIKSLKQERNQDQDWIHFHCAAGRGRTTTFIALYDMMLNAKDVTCEDILKRQFIIGGKDLSEPFDTSDWRYVHGVERLQFLRNFYQYVTENPNLDQTWSMWINNR